MGERWQINANLEIEPMNIHPPKQGDRNNKNENMNIADNHHLHKTAVSRWPFSQHK